jgi:hypothetical protein
MAVRPPDTERQRGNRDGREARIAAQVSPGISAVLHECFRPACGPHVPAFILDLFHRTELHPDPAARIFFVDAGAPHVGNSFFDVEAQFLLEVRFQIVTPQPVPPIH